MFTLTIKKYYVGCPGDPINNSEWFDSRDEALAYASRFFGMRNVSLYLHDLSTSKTECIKSRGEVLGRI